jgi:hypothetical protein
MNLRITRPGVPDTVHKLGRIGAALFMCGFALLWFLAAIVSIGFPIALVYIIWHFASKWW